MKSQYSSFQMVLIGVFLLASCVSAEERLHAKFDTLPQIDSTLLYEYSAISSGATGDCISTFLARWQGTILPAESVMKVYKNSFLKNGWDIRPKEVVEIWSREDKDGLYRIRLSIFTNPTTISQEQGGYKLPNSVLHKFVNYQTVYLLTMTYMYPSAAKKCFGD